MSGDDEQFCKCTTLKSAMNFLIFYTILEAILHLGVAWPVTKEIFGENLWLYLGLMIPLALLTTVRVILMVYAQCNKLDFFAREKNYYFYLISTLVEWAVFITWVTKYYKSEKIDCGFHDPNCHIEDEANFFAFGIRHLWFMVFVYTYIAIGTPFKVWFNYINFRFYMS